MKSNRFIKTSAIFLICVLLSGCSGQNGLHNGQENLYDSEVSLHNNASAADDPSVIGGTEVSSGGAGALNENVGNDAGNDASNDAGNAAGNDVGNAAGNDAGNITTDSSEVGNIAEAGENVEAGDIAEAGDEDMMFKKPVVAAKATGEILGIKYEILKRFSYHLQSETRGYVLDNFNNPDGSYSLFITSGMKPTGGYSIVVTDITAEGDTVIVTVAEQGPAPGATVTTALTYPLCAVQFDKCPETIVVKDNSGNVFDYIDNTI